MKLVILTCDTHSWIIPIFNYFYKKYWPDSPYQIKIVTETKPVDGDVFYAEEESWSTRLIKYLKQSSDDEFLITLEDYLIKSTVDTFRVKLAENLCSDNVGYVRLSNGPYKYFRKHTAHSFPINGFRQYPVRDRFSMVAHMAFYKKQFLLDVLEEGEDIWQAENNGTSRLRRLDSKWEVFWPEINVVDYAQNGGLIKKGLFRPIVLSWALAELANDRGSSNELMILQEKINQGLAK